MNPEPILLPDRGEVTVFYVNGEQVLNVPATTINTGDSLAISYSMDSDGRVREAALIVTRAHVPWWQRAIAWVRGWR